jgi:hypothetical protein
MTRRSAPECKRSHASRSRSSSDRRPLPRTHGQHSCPWVDSAKACLRSRGSALKIWMKTYDGRTVQSCKSTTSRACLVAVDTTTAREAGSLTHQGVAERKRTQKSESRGYSIPALISLLPRIDDDDWIGEEFPDVFSEIGPSSLESIESYARDSQNGEFARICTFRLISQMGCDHPEQRMRCVEILTDLLRVHETNDPNINGFFVSALSDLGALESFEVVREVYEKNHVELSVLGGLREAEYYFKIGANDYNGVDAFVEERLHRLREFSESHPFEPTQIIEKPQPIIAGRKVGRNDLCPCGSGKKYKKCHGFAGTLY